MATPQVFRKNNYLTIFRVENAANIHIPQGFYRIKEKRELLIVVENPIAIRALYYEACFSISLFNYADHWKRNHVLGRARVRDMGQPQPQTSN